jgi:undecaprenyl-diphosphatase
MTIPTRGLAAWRQVVAAALLVLAATSAARAGDVWQLDSFDEREDRGLFSRSNQKRIDALTIGAVVGLALWEGTDTRLGRTAWQAVDAALLTAAATEMMKRGFQRPRPSQDRNPDVWFAGPGHGSFPSGEVAMMAAFATPFAREYWQDHPESLALLALPLYMARGRMASQSHWMTDVLAGGAIGTAVGYYASTRGTPLVLAITPHGAFVGLHYRF